MADRSSATVFIRRQGYAWCLREARLRWWRTFGPQEVWERRSWGVAPGWYKDAPLARKKRDWARKKGLGAEEATGRGGMDWVRRRSWARRKGETSVADEGDWMRLVPSPGRGRAEKIEKPVNSM